MASGSSSSSSNAGDSYIGSLISLISKFEIRYEGILYFLNTQDSTLGLKNVRAYGTEGRKNDGSQVPPCDKVYEYILFRGSDIKDLQVKSSPPAESDEQMYHDPAIIQSHYAAVPLSSPPSASVGGRTLTQSTQGQDTPALMSKAYPSGLSSYQSGTHVGPSSHPPATQNVGGPSFSSPMYWQGYNGTSNSISDALQHSIPFEPPMTASSSLTVQNQIQAPQIQASPNIGLTNSSESVTPVPSSIASSSLHLNFLPFLTSVQSPISPDMPSPSSIKASLPPHAAYITANRLTMSLFPSSCQDTNTTEAQIVRKAVSDPILVHPAQSMPYPASSCVGSASGPMLTPTPSLLTPDRLAQSRPPVLSFSQKMYPDQKDIGALTPISSGYSSPVTQAPLFPRPVTQAPLLPLPVSAKQYQYSTPQFTEEFDFMAMNEKFKKDEVWGHLRKAKQRDETEGMEDISTDQSLGNKGGDGLLPNLDTKPAYNKDEFFDTISCNSLSRGSRNGQHRFSERMKLDTETFGNFQQRPHPGYGGYGRGENYRGPHNWGRGYGYGYGGRGRGGNLPM